MCIKNYIEKIKMNSNLGRSNTPLLLFLPCVHTSSMCEPGGCFATKSMVISKVLLEQDVKFLALRTKPRICIQIQTSNLK